GRTSPHLVVIPCGKVACCPIAREVYLGSLSSPHNDQPILEQRRLSLRWCIRQTQFLAIVFARAYNYANCLLEQSQARHSVPSLKQAVGIVIRPGEYYCEELG